MGLREAATRAAIAGLFLIAGIARANGIITSVNFGLGNLDGGAALDNANAGAGLTSIPPYLVALSRNADNPVAATFSPAGQAGPLALQFAGNMFENPLFATGPFQMPAALPPPAVTMSHPVGYDYGQSSESTPGGFHAALNVAPPIPPAILSLHVDEAAVEAWAENERRNHENWSFPSDVPQDSQNDTWFYNPSWAEPVPEPGTVALFSLGLAALFLRRRFHSV